MTNSVYGAQPSDAVRLSFQDVTKLAPEERAVTRYLWVSVEEPKQKWGAFVACSGHCNALSLKRRLVAPTLVLADGSTRQWPNVAPEDWASLALLRVNISRYGWSPSIWERLGDPALEPLFHVFTIVPYPAGRYTDGRTYPAGEEKATALAPWLLQPLPMLGPDPDCVKATIGLSVECGYSACPIVEADNFIWQTAIQFDRKAGYYDWLGVKSLKDFDVMVGFNEKASIKYAQPQLEAVSESNVAQQPRRVEVFEKIGGRYLRTKDQVNQRGIGKRNPLTTHGLNDLLFDAFEIYAMGSNGWWKNCLADKNGVLQDSAPDGVGYHHQTITNDGKIHVYLTCNSCHDARAGNGGLQSFAPFFRNKYAAPGPLGLADKVFKRLADLEDQYLSTLDLSPDQRRYAAAVFEATGQTPDVFAAQLLASFTRWDSHVDLALAARRYGVTEAELIKAFGVYLTTFGKIDSVNDTYLLPKERRSKIGIDQFSEAYNAGQLMLRGIPTWPQELRKKYPSKPR